jgi:beta-lactamase class C
MNRVFLIFIIFIFSAGCSSRTTKLDSPVKTENKKDKLSIFINRYESIFKTNFAATGAPGAAVVIVKDSSIIYQKGFGIKEIGKPDSIGIHTVFRIASLSKGFTAVLTSILVNRGILSWEDKVVDYIPEFALMDTAQTNRIRIKHLLSHSTGLPRHSLIEMIDDGKTMKQMIAKLKTVKIEGLEGETFGYQNTTFAIIQEIIYRKTNRTIEDWMQKEIFDKAGMKHASMGYDALMNEPDKCMPHEKNSKKNWVVRSIHDKYYQTGAAGGINASISDMGQWLLVLLGNRPDITPKGSTDFIWTPFITHDSLSYFDRWSGVSESSYGMGWRILKFHDKKIICHGGNVNDYRGEIAFDPESKIGVCFLFNSQNYYSMTCVPNFFETYYLYEELVK